MTWTRNKPTVAGWYWNRINGTVGIALIMRRDCQLYVWLKFKDAWLSREGWLDYIHGEWLGPITPDSYQQGRVAGLREACIAVSQFSSDGVPINADELRIALVQLLGSLAQQAQGGGVGWSS